MSWPKPEITPVNPPDKPRGMVWILLFLTLVFVSGMILILSWDDNHYLSSALFWLVLILFPFIIGGAALSIRFYLYGLALERYDIWQQEQGSIDNNWQDWAMRSVSVIGSYWHTPNGLSVSKILFDGQNLPMQIEKELPFDDDELEYVHYFEALFDSLKSALNRLPEDVKLAVTVYSSTDAYRYIDDDILKAYQGCAIKPSFTLSHHLINNAQAEKIIELIDDPQPAAQLLIMNNILSDGSAFLAALLLIDSSSYPELVELGIESEILRPMITENFVEGIAQMTEMQPAVLNVAQLWYANLDKEQEVEVAKQLAEHAISPKSIYYLDSIAGKQTDFAYWSLLALGSKLVKESQQTVLVVTASQEKYLFSVVANPDLGHNK